MALNTQSFARFIRDARSGLTQDQVHERGGPYRQMQSRIEGGDPVELEDNVLASYDKAHRWPRDYSAAVATVGMFSEGVEPLAQNLIDGELHPTDAGATG